MTMTDDKGRKKASQSLNGLSYERDLKMLTKIGQTPRLTPVTREQEECVL